MKRIEIKKLGDSHRGKPLKFIELYFGGFLHSRKCVICGNNGQGNGSNKDKNKGDKAKHLGWYKNKNHPKYPGTDGSGGSDLINPEIFEVTNYINDVSLENEEVLMTTDINGDYRAAYTYGLEEIGVEDLMEVEGKPNNPLYYLQDAIGSVTAITNMNSEVIDSNRFAPYGEALDSVAKNARLTNSPYGFTGEMHDIEGDLVYLRARYYSPNMARFIQQDTYLGEVEEPLSRNLYIYANGNPMKSVDPSGHSVDRGYESGDSFATTLKVPANKVKLEMGSKGEYVTYLQILLNRTITGTKLSTDGDFGPLTDAAVRKFQSSKKLAVDGKVGPITWGALESPNPVNPTKVVTVKAADAKPTVQNSSNGASKPSVYETPKPRLVLSLGSVTINGSKLGTGNVGDFSGLKNPTIDDILTRIPANANNVGFDPEPGRIENGFKYEWEANGLKWEVWGHEADPVAPQGSNSNEGWTYRIVKTKINPNDRSKTTGRSEYWRNDIQGFEKDNKNGRANKMNETHNHMKDPTKTNDKHDDNNPNLPGPPAVNSNVEVSGKVYIDEIGKYTVDINGKRTYFEKFYPGMQIMPVNPSVSFPMPEFPPVLVPAW